MCIWKELMLWWFIPCENWVKLLWVCWLDLDTSMGVSATCGWCRNVPMCLRNLQNVGAWGPNGSWDIVLPTSPYICWSHPRFWALALCPWIYQHLSSGLEMFLCVSGTSKINLVYGALTEAQILTYPLSHVFSQFGLILGNNPLPMDVSTPAKWYINVPMSLRNLQKYWFIGP